MTDRFNTPIANMVIWFATLARIARHQASRSIAMSARHDARSIAMHNASLDRIASMHNASLDRVPLRHRGRDVSEGDRGDHRANVPMSQCARVQVDRPPAPHALDWFAA